MQRDPDNMRVDLMDRVDLVEQGNLFTASTFAKFSVDASSLGS
jgi:hypothetical protein